MKTSELTGIALDWAVAKCEGATNLHYDTVATWWVTLNSQDRALSKGWSSAQNYHPSSNWEQGGRIIEREGIAIQRWLETGWIADRWNFRFVSGHSNGPTPLIAAMRCLCRAKLGDEIDIPKGLL